MELDTKSLAAAVGVSRATLWNWRCAGLIPSPTVRGRRSIFSPAAVAIARNLAEAAR